MVDEKFVSHDQDSRDPFLIRNPWFSIIMIIILYFLFLFFPQTFYVGITTNLLIEPKLYITQIIVFLSIALLLLVIVPFLFRIPNNNKNYTEYLRDIQIQGTYFKAIGIGLLTTIILFVCALGSSFLTIWFSKIYLNSAGIPVPEDPYLVVDPSYLLDPNVFMNLYYMINPGLWEEIVFRGIILGLLLKKYRVKTAVIMDGVLFGLYHLVNLLDPAIGYSMGLISQSDFHLFVLQTGFQVVYATCLGIMWAIMFLKSRSIIPCILSHWLLDAFGGLLWSTNYAVPWIKLLSLTVIGIGALPMILNIFIMRGFYPKFDNEILKEKNN